MEVAHRWTGNCMASATQAVRTGQRLAWLPRERIRDKLAAGSWPNRCLKSASAGCRRSWSVPTRISPDRVCDTWPRSFLRRLACRAQREARRHNDSAWSGCVATSRPALGNFSPRTSNSYAMPALMVRGKHVHTKALCGQRQRRSVRLYRSEFFWSARFVLCGKTILYPHLNAHQT